MRILCLIAPFLFVNLLCGAQPSGKDHDLFNKLPQAISAEEIGKRVSERFLSSGHPVYAVPGSRPHITYFEVCVWYGALTFAKESGDASLAKRLGERFEPLLTTDSSLVPVADHVDYSVFGALPLELFLQTNDARYFDLGKRIADQQWGPPEGPRVVPESYTYYEKGLTWQTRLWIDDMYMITLLQAQAFRATQDKKYIERTAKEMVFYLDQLQKPNGLFYHAPNVPFYWGRGNGWMAAGMTELLRVLPEDNPDRKKIMKGYQTMMASLLQYQGKDGMWRQLVDDPESWPETSSTGMFTFAMITGLKNKWLKESVYGDAAYRAWTALVSYLDETSQVREVCEGTGAKDDRQYYLDRKRVTGDFHGQAPILWCATALLRKK